MPGDEAATRTTATENIGSDRGRGGEGGSESNTAAAAPANVDNHDPNHDNIQEDPSRTPREQQLLTGLKRLDDEYQSMWQRKKVLLQALEHLEKDERLLTEALSKAQATSKGSSNNRGQNNSNKRPKVNNKDTKALQRLQQALLAAESSSDDDDSDEN